MTVSKLPFLDLTAEGFSTKSDAVLSARAQNWCARTPFGLAVLRHRQAGQLLRDRHLRQGSHAWPVRVGIQGAFADFWRRSIISLEGEDHRQLRLIAQKALAEADISALRPRIGQIARELINPLRQVSDFDMVDEFTEPFAGRAITALLDVPDHMASTIARDASALGLAMGLDARDHEAVTNAACERLLGLADTLIQQSPQQGFVARLLDAARDAGLTERQPMVDLIVISIFGGVDTTRAQLAFAAYLFARHPDQWTWLRANLGHVPNAIEEVIRTYPTTTWATREALEDFEFDGVAIKAGETLNILVHASGTDPETGPYDGFDIKTGRKAHFGFGGGAHHCLGHFVARTDMAAALEVLLESWSGIRLSGTPTFLPDSGNTSPSRLHIAPVWA